MKFLVTGGAGFIGSHLVDRLIADGHQVAVVDNLSEGKREQVNPKARFHEADITDPGLADIFAHEKPEIVSHHAAQVNVRLSVDDPLYDARVNVLGSINVLEAAVRSGCRKILYASSGGACYGEPEEIPTPETSPVRPLCPYGVTKHTVEHYLELYAALHGFSYTVLRYANVYGPRQDPHGEAGVVAIFATLMLKGEQPKIFGDGAKTRDYVHVSDVVQANLRAIDAPDGIYNVGLGRQVTDYEIFAAVRDALGVGVEPLYTEKRPGEVDHIALDGGRLCAIGWSPEFTLETGIPHAVEYYRAQHAQPR